MSTRYTKESIGGHRVRERWSRLSETNTAQTVSTATGQPLFEVAPFDAGGVDDGGTFTSDLEDINDDGAADVLIMPATEAINDAFYLGKKNKFEGVRIKISTAGADGGAAGAVWEYYNGVAWGTLTVTDGTQSSIPFDVGTGWYDVYFALPFDWAPGGNTDVSADSDLFLIRLRVTGADYSTNPVATQMIPLINRQPARTRELIQVTAHYDGSVTKSVTVTLNSGLGSEYDTLLNTISITAADGIYLPAKPVSIMADDVIDVVAAAGGSNRESAVIIITETEEL